MTAIAERGNLRGPVGLRLGAIAPALVVIIVGIAASALGFTVVRTSDDARVASILRLRAEWRARDFQAKIQAAADPVHGLETYIAAAGTVDAAHFGRFADWAHLPGDPTRTLIWAPRVPAAERAGFEAQARAEGVAGFSVLQLGPGGALVPAAQRAEYFPVRLEHRFEGQASLLGFDLTSERNRALTAARARDEGRAVATPPVALIRAPSSDPHYQVFWPVYAGTGTPGGVEARRAALRGFAVGNFRIKAVLAAALRGTPTLIEAMDFFTTDAAAELQPVAAYDPDTDQFRTLTDARPPAQESIDTITESFDVLGRHWMLVSHFSPDVVAGLRSSGPLATLSAGLLLTLMLAAYVYRERSRRRATEAIADQRTADLRTANQALHSEAEQRQQAQQQLVQAVKMEAIGNLTGGMAHDFNNLLGVIIGNLDLLRETEIKDPEVEELTREALDAAMRGADLIRGLLAFARRQPLRPQQVDVNHLVSGIAKLLRRVLGENVEVNLKLGRGLWPVLADPAQLEAALANLATNARDAMPKGGRLIIATANRHLDADYAAEHPEVTPGDYAMIEVSDTGSGIPPEMLSRIFEPFFTTKEHGRGSGLGLAMVFGYIKQSGGHINVYSEVGAGTTFRLYLPRARGAGDMDELAEAEKVRGGDGETVLVVEDNPALRRVAVRQLTELGYAVRQAENARGALDLLEAGAPVDVLFTDVVMPGTMDGFGLAQIVITRWPGIKIVLTSGFPGTKIADESDIRLLGKPYRKEELARALRDVLDGEGEEAGDAALKGEPHGDAAGH